MHHINNYFKQVAEIANKIDHKKINDLALSLKSLREQNGRLFILGVGGSAGNATHAVNDFRKLCNIETYSPTDNVSELTARTNDDGWETVFSKWLQVSKLSSNDAVLVFSVGGGNAEKNVSTNIIKALDLAKSVSAKILGIVSRDGGHTAKNADVCVLIPTVDDKLVTPLAEAYQGVVWHCLVSHPELQVVNTKW